MTRNLYRAVAFGQLMANATGSYILGDTWPHTFGIFLLIWTLTPHIRITD